MAQKSLSVVHRIDNSMTWEMRIFNKQNKWLSYSLWIIYTYLYKLVFFIQVYKNYVYNNLHTSEQTFRILKKKKIIPLNIKKRFCYYISLYSFEFLNFIILLSIFFQISLKTLSRKKQYKNKNKYKALIFF